MPPRSGVDAILTQKHVSSCEVKQLTTTWHGRVQGQDSQAKKRSCLLPEQPTIPMEFIAESILYYCKEPESRRKN